MSQVWVRCRFCGVAIALDPDTLPENIVVRGVELAHRTCVFDQAAPPDHANTKQWKDLSRATYGLVTATIR